MGHADGAIHLRQYIYNIKNDEDTDDVVRIALSGNKNIETGNQIKIVI